MSKTPRFSAASRRTFLKAAAGVTAGTVLPSLWSPSAAAGFPKIDPRLMITPQQAFDWNMFKAEGGPTYAGSAGWKRRRSRLY